MVQQLFLHSLGSDVAQHELRPVLRMIKRVSCPRPGICIVRGDRMKARLAETFGYPARAAEEIQAGVGTTGKRLTPLSTSPGLLVRVSHEQGHPVSFLWSPHEIERKLHTVGLLDKLADRVTD
jgi:hypothetical protein